MLYYTTHHETAESALLLLHGFMGASADWRDIVRHFPNERCVCVDLPFHGESTQFPLDISAPFEATCAALADVLDALHIKKSAVLGYSMGGRVALYFALKYPERVHSLILESATAGCKSIEEQRLRVAADALWAQKLRRKPFPDFLAEWYAQPLWHSLHRSESLIRQVLNRPNDVSPEAFAQSLQWMGTGSMPKLWPHISSLSMPVLSLAGALDPKFCAIGREMAALNTKIQLKIIPNAGHNVHLEAEKQYVQTVQRFLNEHPNDEKNPNAFKPILDS